MKITDTSQQIIVMLNALESGVIPELRSNGAKTLAGLIKTNLKELLKRETTIPSMLSAANREGDEIVGAMKTLLNESATPSPIAERYERTSNAKPVFRDASREYEVLVSEMAKLSAKLSVSRSGASDAVVSALMRRAATWECNLHVHLGRATAPAVVDEALAQASLSRSALESYLQSVHSDGREVAIVDFERIHGGFAKQTYKFSLRDASGTITELFVRKMDRVPIFSCNAYLIEREFHLLQAVHQAGFSVPEPLWVTTTPPPGIDANFCIVKKMRGSPPGSYLEGASQVPEGVLLDMAKFLGRLHGTHLTQFAAYIAKFENPTLYTESVEACYRRTIDNWHRYTKELYHLPSPVLTYLFDWLGRNMPRDTRSPVLLHGNYGVHNVMAENGRVTGVLDWESSMFGAPEQELEWMKPNIVKHIDWNRFISHYIDSGGREPDERSSNFYAAYNAMFALVGAARSIHNLQSGATPDIRITTIENGFAIHHMTYAMENTREPG